MLDLRSNSASSSSPSLRWSSLVVPIRYGVSAVILITLVYAIFHLIPLIRRDLRLLHEVQSVDVQGIALERQLQSQIQENRRETLSIVLGTQRPDGTSSHADQSIERQDQQIQQTLFELEKLDFQPKSDLNDFRNKWVSYVSTRKRLFEAKSSNPQDLKSVEPDLGSSSFAALQESVQKSAENFEEVSARHIREVSRELSRTLTELLISMVIKFGVLGLLVWMEFRRITIEKELERANRKLRGSEERFRGAYESASVGMGLFKLDGTIISSNRKAAEILGYEISELLGRKVSEFMAPECVDDHVHKIETLPGTGQNNYQTERRIIRKDGSSAWVRNSVTLLQREGEEPQYFSISEEITRQKEAHDRLAYLANYDAISNLPNRQYFEQLLSEAMNPTAGHMVGVALLYAEIDSFDFLKGTFGRTVADEVLGELGQSLADIRLPGEIIARLDDHVIVMLVKAAPYDEGTLMRAGQLREIFHGFASSGKHRIPISASIGLAYSSDADNSRLSLLDDHPGEARHPAGADNLIKFARAAMLEARLRGGDCIHIADPALQERAAQKHQIELALLKGLREDEFRVVFQPQFEVATGRLVRFEALCRWTSAELGPIPPDRFIPIAEQTGLILEIGKRVMIEALRQAKTWAGAGKRVGVAVNISPMQFMRPDFPNMVTEILAETRFPAALLELEITEGIFIRDLNLAVARIRELQRLGLSIALDDFGTGYSSLSYLQRMPINAVKLDRSFVSDLTTDAATVSMVRSVLSMAEALNLRVVTEGVETEEQLSILKSLGCEEAQGYLMGRPESSELAYARVLKSSAHAPKSVRISA